MREIDFALRKISKRTHNKFVMQASLHGYKLPAITDAPPVEAATPEMQAAHDEHLRQAQERKLREKRGG